MKWQKGLGGFTTDERFKYSIKELELSERSPGPITADGNMKCNFQLPKIDSKKGRLKLF